MALGRQIFIRFNLNIFLIRYNKMFLKLDLGQMKRMRGSINRRWTHRLIQKVDTWMNCDHREVNYYVTQMLSGHSRKYLHRFKREDSPECPTCIRINEDTELVFFIYQRYNKVRNSWEPFLGRLCFRRRKPVLPSASRVFARLLMQFLFNVMMVQLKPVRELENFL